MDSCCENKAGELALLREKQSRVLYIVLAINAVMFLVEFGAGWLVDSTALLGDSLDMLGDASVYALTLFVLHRSDRARIGAALVKGAFMLLFGVVVVADAAYKLYVKEVPAAELMGIIGFIALLANGVCFALLHAHRSDDLNMSSTWLCSRNDLIANSCVIMAAVLVAVTNSLWPDVIVGIAIAMLFLHSASQVIAEAWREWRTVEVQPAKSPSCSRIISVVPAQFAKDPSNLLAGIHHGEGIPSKPADCCSSARRFAVNTPITSTAPVHSPPENGSAKSCCG